MSHLDQAIRAELETGYWRLSRQTSTAADKGARAILSTLDLHTHTTADGIRVGQRAARQCAACGLIIRSEWCDTVTVIADDVLSQPPVSSQDTPPAPRPAPFTVERDSRGRLWTERDGEMWQFDPKNPLVLNGPPESRREVNELYGPLTEVPSPSTQTGGHQ